MRIKDFLKSGHPPTLFSAFLYFDISFMVWVLMGVLGVYISKEFGLTPAQKGFMAAVPILGGSLVRLPLGFLVDHLGPKKTGILGQLIVFTPLLGIWLFAPHFQTVLAFGLLLGIAGGSFAVALPLASRWYPAEHQGMALGIAGAGNSGTVLASLFAPVLAEIVGWRNVFGLALIPVTLTLLVFIFLAKESPTQPKPKKLADYFLVFKEADTFWFCFFYGVTFGGFVGMASFLGIFFYDQFGLSKVMAGQITALCVFAGSFIRPVGGYLADRFGGVRILSVLFGCVALLMFGISFLPPLAATVFLIFLVMAALGMGNGSVFQLVPLRFQKEIGVMTGIVGAAGGLGGFFLPTLLGFFKQTMGSYGVGFLIFAGTALSALVLLRAVQKGWSCMDLLPAVTPVPQPVLEDSRNR
ncbi:MAG: NarK/NasA family nitrate transporter [Candidatus Omnitrophica bacterium]|nr:NarK/NasA family nitrate transporter [Candidatus Omnitrophota bacterium]